MDTDIKVIKLEASIKRKTNAKIDESQKEYYLREQLRVIKEQLGETAESDDYIDRIIEMQFPEEIEAKLLKDAELVK